MAAGCRSSGVGLELSEDHGCRCSSRSSSASNQAAKDLSHWLRPGAASHSSVSVRGSGAVPLWLAELFPESQVDVVELEAGKSMQEHARACKSSVGRAR